MAKEFYLTLVFHASCEKDATDFKNWLQQQIQNTDFDWEPSVLYPTQFILTEVKA